MTDQAKDKKVSVKRNSTSKKHERRSSDGNMQCICKARVKILHEKRPLHDGTFWQLRITNVQTQPFFIRGLGIFEPSAENDRQAL